MIKLNPLLFCCLTLFFCGCNSLTPNTLNTEHKDGVVQKQDRSYLLTAADGRTMRITGYGDEMVRLQRVKPGESFYPDKRYEMVENHDWNSDLTAKMLDNGKVQFSTSKISLTVDPESFVSTFSLNDQLVLAEKHPISSQENLSSIEFEYDDSEHFSGLGHGYYGRESSLDLRGRVLERNYGKEQIEQAPLIVPFYLSSKGYGVFLNSMFSNRFNFGKDNQYQIAIDDHGFGGQLDYFFIAGPKLTRVLDNYTQLTGRPRLPAKSMFGLQLSDKGHDHDSPTPSDENWWKSKITEHRAAGYPLDHVVNDNRWRAAGGKRCESKIEWDKERYPDPEDYANWLAENGLVTTLDFNRCIGQFSEGWKAEFNLPQTGKIDFKDSAPDLTNPDFQRWFWQVFYDKSLNPELGYPGDALWIDEFDEQGGAPKNMLLANGLSSAEMRNYWFFLIAKSLVGEGWDKSDVKKRPFVWVRGMTAGAQRWATLWSGDIYPNYEDMAGQVRAMQLAGLSGFPFWGHDAGGFFDWDKGVGPDEAMYQQWAMAFGSFAPIWKPHGMGESRWPLDRSQGSQEVAHHYSKLRYELMPYLYSAAHQAAATGIPMARPMLLEHQNESEAWLFDLQYYWGDSMLVAPLTADKGSKNIWLPDGKWYGYQSNQLIDGGQVITHEVQSGELPLFVKQGAIIPKRKYVQSTAFIDKEHLDIDIYVGADGHFVMTEDDDFSEQFSKEAEMRKTVFLLNDSKRILSISAATGSFDKAPGKRSYRLRVFGTMASDSVKVNGQSIEHEFENNILLVTLPSMLVTKSVEVSF